MKKWLGIMAVGFLLLSSTGLPVAGAKGEEREPSHTEIKEIDGTNVLFQYGKPVPSFDTWDDKERSRDTISLNGKWRFTFDPEQKGMDEEWYQSDYDDKHWLKKSVPSSWDLFDTPGFGSYDGSRYGEGTAFYDGYAWFRTTFKADREWDDQFIKVNFLGVNYQAMVFINGQHVATHEGGHTPFSIDASPYVKAGKDNVIAVRVFRRPWYDSYKADVQNPITDDKELPYKPVDYWPYAGITRDVYVEVTSPVTVSKILTKAAGQQLDVSAVLYNHGDRVAKKRVIFDPERRTGGKKIERTVTLNAGETKVLSETISIPNAKHWDLSSPHLYDVTVKLQSVKGKTEDGLKTSFGMRTIEVKGGKLLLNDRPIFLKGLNWHEETAKSGRSLTKNEYKKELGMILDTDANFVRNSVYNRHPYVYEFADENGLLVMDDIDNMWLNTEQQEYQTNTYGLSDAIAASMAWNQVNRPSVILWGLQNESESSDAAVYRNWIASMKNAIKALDPQDRPVTWASSTSWDPAFDLADVIGFNEYFGYFYGQNADLGATLDQVHRNHPGKPILITENGTWSVLGNDGPVTEQGTESWQAEQFRQHWDQATERKDFMAGYTFWALKDYKQRMTYNHDYNGISAMGLVTFDKLEKKQVYKAFKKAVNPNP
ncbi:glycoside hydrolase family 2 protein [Rossellomorea sp. FS2]|uniref:glycoside hydrolase family 2 protein n=1 Tax=Rossellomorea sp. FS2 TaxID=3391447 RepID=UPI003A4DD981